MKLSEISDRYYGLRNCLDRAAIIDFVRSSKNFNRRGNESLAEAKTLLLSESRKRNSWLVRSDQRLYKLIDDREEERPRINWSIDMVNVSAGVVSIVEVGAVFSRIAFDFRPGKKYVIRNSLFANEGLNQTLAKFLDIEAPVDMKYASAVGDMAALRV